MSNSKQSKTKLLWSRFYLWAFGVFLVYSSYGTLLSLQSSINVEGGLGTMAIASIYLSGATLSLFCVPALVRRFGAKKCAWCSEIAHFTFTVINLHAKWYTMFPASIFVGLGDIMLWVCMPIMNTFFAEIYAMLRDEPGNEIYKAMFSSYFFGVFQMAKIVGNLASYGILYGFGQHSALNETGLTSGDSTSNITIDLMYCGANDCQDSAIVEDMINQYVPSNEWTMRVLLILLALFCVVAIAVHIVCVPTDLRIFGISSTKIQEELCDKKLMTPDGSTEFSPSDDTETKIVAGQGHSTINATDRAHVIGMVARSNQNDCCNYAVAVFKATLSEMITCKQILLTPITTYVGLGYAFITSELSRSYSSCIFGVAWVPIHSLIYGVGACMMSYGSGRLSKIVARYYLIAFAAIVDAAMYIYCRVWTPSESHASVVLMFFLLGGTQGIWTPISQVLQMLICHDRVNIGSSIWNFWFFVGIGIQCAWSSSMCVYSKIFIQIGMLGISLLAYGILERMLQQDKNQKATTDTLRPVSHEELAHDVNNQGKSVMRVESDR